MIPAIRHFWTLTITPPGLTTKGIVKKGAVSEGC